MPGVQASVAPALAESVTPAMSSHTKGSFCAYSGVIYRHIKPQCVLMIIWEHEGREK